MPSVATNRDSYGSLTCVLEASYGDILGLRCFLSFCTETFSFPGLGGQAHHSCMHEWALGVGLLAIGAAETLTTCQ